MKTKQTPFYFNNHYQYTDYSTGVPDGPYDVGPINSFIGNNIVTTGDSPSNWRQLIASGGNASSALSGEVWRKTCVPSSLDYSIKHKNPLFDPTKYRYTLKGNMMAYFLGNGSADVSGAIPFLSEADSQARSRFYQRLSEVQSQFKGAVFTGELGETLRAIRNPAQALRRGVSDYLDHLKRGFHRKPPKYLPSFIRESWLEYSFGWKPLVSDLEDAMVAFYKSRWTRPIFQMVRSSGRAGPQPIQQPLQAVSAGVNGLQLQFHREIQVQCEVKYYGVYHSHGAGPSTFRYYGFSPWEFVPTLWELMPYSFLVDYFTNIGDILSAWSYRNIGCEWASRGEKISNRSEIRDAKILALHQDYPMFSLSGVPGSSTVEYALIARNPSVSIPLPDFQLRVPGMSTKWLNILALSKQFEATRRLALRKD